MPETLAGPAVRPRLASIPRGEAELSSSGPLAQKHTHILFLTAQHSLNTLAHTDILQNPTHMAISVFNGSEPPDATYHVETVPHTAGQQNL